MLQATTSPYLSALQAAVTNQYRPAKSDIDDFCFICGNRTATGQAYCSDECRQQDEMQSPAPSAVPALVPSSRTGHKSDGSSPPSSATSSPSKIGEGDDEEEDIEKLILPPPVGSYNKRNNFSYGYAYGLATSPVVATAKSLTKSPIVRSTPIQKSKSGQSAGVASPPLAASTETITFRRRPQHDSMNGSKANSAMSPALLARRRPSANQSRPSTAPSSSSPATTTSTSSSSSQTSASASPAASSLSNILRGQSRSSYTVPAKPLAHMHAHPTCSRTDCPVSSTLPLTAFAPLQRRVSEPHSPYASPKICDGVDPFESSFAIHREASVRRVSDITGRRRPSLSTVTTAPPAISLGLQQNQASDYAGFAGFLFARHNQTGQRVDRPDAAENSESGYEAHDEQDRGRRRPSAKKTSSKDGLYMRDLRGDSASASSKASKPSSSGLKDKLARVMMSSSSSSDSTTAAPARPTRFIFGRGPASKPAVQQESTAAISEGPQPVSSSDEERQVKTAAVIAPPSRPKHNHSTSVGEGSQYIVTIRPSHKGQRDTSIRPPLGVRKDTRDSAIATSSSEEDNELAVEALHPQETTQERGRTQNRRPSSAARVPLVSPFTALQRAAQGTESRKPDGNSPGAERGRSSQRRSSAAFRSQSPARSHSRASSRSQRRVVT